VLGILLSAIDSRQAVQFPHRPSRAEPYTKRTVEPWGVVTERGRWYLVGHDRDRDDTRVFRLSRIGAEVAAVGPTGAITIPDDVDLRRIVAQTVSEVSAAPGGGTARVWVADGRATALRRDGTSIAARQLAGRDGEVLELNIGSADQLARDIAGHGADAVVLEPQSLCEDVLARLRAHAEERRR
jgi:proteasome accessory factor B